MKRLDMADLFAGAGGTSTGVLMAAEDQQVQIRLTAINHWRRAIDTHELNHPNQRHRCATIDQINIDELYPTRKIDLLWASPECTHHSRARGKKPKQDQSRASGWCVVRWAHALNPDIIWVENVPEYVEWGPLDENGVVVESEKGTIFQAWLSALRALGYEVEYQILCAADYGDPTIRRRLIVQAVKKGRQKIRWPEATHSEKPEPGKLPWVAIDQHINWNHPSRSIFGRKKPMSEATLRRIGIGLPKIAFKGLLDQYQAGTLDLTRQAESFLIPQQRGHVYRSTQKPMPTITASGADALVTPFLLKYYGTGACAKINEPLDTVTAKARFGLAEPFLLQFTQSHERNDSSSVIPLTRPMRAVTAQAEHALVNPFLVHLRGTSTVRQLQQPSPTITAGCHLALVELVMADRSQPCLELTLGQDKLYFDILYRMMQPDELAAAQGFPSSYQFTGTKTEMYRQIGNAVPCGLSRALLNAQLPFL